MAHIPFRAELVSDDRVILTHTPQGIETAPPPALAGKIEVRGVGILELPYRRSAMLTLAIDLVAADDIPRYPLDRATATFLGVEIPLVHLAPFEASAPVKLLLALHRACGC
jgi:HPr kinase/phosphorylase